MQTELKPQFENVKSYYGKARVDTIFGETLRLISYSTVVAKYEVKTQTLTIHGEYSSTTLRHIKEFAQQLGFPKLSVSDMRKHGYVLVKGEI